MFNKGNSFIYNKQIADNLCVTDFQNALTYTEICENNTLLDLKNKSHSKF